MTSEGKAVASVDFDPLGRDELMAAVHRSIEGNMAVAPALQALHDLLTNGPLPYAVRDDVQVCLAHELPFSRAVRLNPPSGYPDVDLARAARNWPNAALYDVLRYVQDPDAKPPAQEAVRACPKCREEAFAQYPEVAQRYAAHETRKRARIKQLREMVWAQVLIDDLRRNHPDISDEEIDEILLVV